MSKLKELEKRLKDEPESLGLRVLLAGALHEAGRRNDSIELYYSVALAYRDQGRTQQAISVCRSVLAIAPEDERSQQLLSALVTREPVRAGERLSPPRLPRPPMPGGTGIDSEPAGESDSEATEADPEGDLARPSSSDVTPLPAPLPYHIADPTAAMPVITASELPLASHEELARYPQLAGIADAARQISESLIAASSELVDEDVAYELQTRRLPKITASDLEKISGPPPVVDRHTTVDDSDDDPTLLGSTSGVVGSDGDGGIIDEEMTEPRDLPLHVRPHSIAPPIAAAGPLGGAFFAPLPPRNRAAVLQRFRRRSAATGTRVIRRGETGHGLFIVVRGLLELHAGRPEDDARIVLGAIAPGEYVGEASLLAHAPAAVNVVAAVDSDLLVLGELDFHEVIGSFPVLRAELKQVAERRAREQDQRLRS